MADEITILSGISVLKGNLYFSVPAVAYQDDMTGTGGPTPGYVTLGTTEESIALSELSTVGWFWMKNLDSANYVRWGFSTGVYGGRIRAGETAGPFRLEPGTTLYMIANTAACKMLVYAFES
ncbi:hypothetical protein VN12_02290 [Pirellula sp. SH-Sr6A]|uniref:hypothetical protein n=1 Tax=Pirellula sp. SH-Sr6A TaxID=1632865 RepID=UPI00078EA5FE|nr:hypothetical protein [Pirellula sp. SH-Sr6A]AMV30916.1 hypothetical protein VN12_02290 [Pirellula sp. SH-Sr6A]